MSEKQLTKKQKKFIEAFWGAANGCYKTAAKIAGYSEKTNPWEIANSVRDELVNGIKTQTVLNSKKALDEIMGVLLDPTKPGAANILKAADKILDKSLPSAKEAVEQVKDVPNTVVILPALKYHDEPVMKTVNKALQRIEED